MVNIYIALVLLIPCFTFGQSEWDISGSLSVYSDHYYCNAQGDSTLKGRRPSSNTRFLFNPYLRKGNHFKLLLNSSLSLNQTNTITLKSGDQIFTQFIQNPANTFSALPTYKWVTVIL